MHPVHAGQVERTESLSVDTPGPNPEASLYLGKRSRLRVVVILAMVVALP